MSFKIDLNADLGEGCGDDAAIMKVVTRCNIACGGHAGDAESMKAALHLAKVNGVVAGAHPSYPDRDNFGRTKMDMSEDALSRVLSEQVEALQFHALSIGVSLSHLKPHGALYNCAAKDAGLARVVAHTAADLLPEGALLGPPQSELEIAAGELGLKFMSEAFADRVYESDGSLRSRSFPDALITHADESAAQALQIAIQGEVTSHGGDTISVPAKTICLHSDTPGAVLTAQRVRAAFQANGVEVTANV